MENVDITQLVAAIAQNFVTLFIISSPLGAVPIFLAMTARDDLSKRRQTSSYAAITASLTLIIAALIGEALFGFFGITINAFRIAGAVLLFLYSIDMVQMRTPRMKTTDEEIQEGVAAEHVGVVPLGLPMLAGPGSIVTAMVLRLQGTHQPTDLWALLIAITLLGVVIWAIFMLALRIQPWLGPVTMGILIRVQGLLLATIAVQMAVSGIQGAFGLTIK